MKPRRAPLPAESYVHGFDGPVVLVPARVAAVLWRRTTLGEYAANYRSDDPEVDHVVQALKRAVSEWRQLVLGSDCGPSLSDVDSADASLPGQYSTAQAARQLGITDRSVRRAITQGRLKATELGGRWVLAPEDVAHYGARRAG